MGNKLGLGRKKDLVDDKYTRPQGLYQHRDIDHKKLRKLILDSKLAPCYPGDEDSLAPDLEECPICFLYYPSLNRSRCCMKGICTECFLQMKPPHSTRPTQCPFCKTSNYAVEYRGMRTKEEKGKEQIEEQKVIEAKIRMQLEERHENEERLQKKQAMQLSSQTMTSREVEYRNMPSNSISVQGDELTSSPTSRAYSLNRQLMHSRQNREEEFDLDLEELMVMEAIWLSIQDRGNTADVSSLAASTSRENCTSHMVVPAESSSSGGLVCAAAALAEHQHFNEGSPSLSGANSFLCETIPITSSLPAGDNSVSHYAPENWADASSDIGDTVQLNERDWAMDARPLHDESVAEAGTSYACLDESIDRRTALQVSGGTNVVNGHLIPETFEEQMMLALAVSLAEARSRASSQGTTWM